MSAARRTVLTLLALAVVAVPTVSGPLGAQADTTSRTATSRTTTTPAAMAPGTSAGTPQQVAASARTRVTTQLTAADHRRVERTLARMTLAERIGQLFVVSFAGTASKSTNATNAKANRQALGVDTAAQAVRRYHVGGVIYFSANITSPQQLAALSGSLQRTAVDSGANVPLSISIDQEGGTVWRLGTPASMSPGNMAVGATGDPRNAYLVGSVMAQEMRALGVTWNLAPVADVNTQQYNQVDGARSFGDDPQRVPAYVRAAVQGQRAGGVASAVKHFPGLGSSKQNSDVAIALSSQTAAQFRSRDLPAFAAAIDADVESVLTAHLVAPKLVGSTTPTSLSRRVITGILRDELGFDGAVITDTLQAAALQAIPPKRVVVQAILAGNDMLLMPVNLPAAVQAIRSAVRDGTITRQRLDDSVRRILEMKLKAGMLDPPWRGSLAEIGATVGTPDHLATMGRVALDSVTLIGPKGARVPLGPWVDDVLVAGTGTTAVPQMASTLSAMGFRTTSMVTGFGATAQTIAGAVAAARKADAVVLLTYDVFGDGGQKRLIPALIGTGVPVVVVPVDGPYDAAWASGAAAVVTSYGYTPTNLQAVASVLVGRTPTGRLPVAIRTKGLPPHRIQFPRGWGLAWSS
ncbi:MAG: glycoside hydrolase family 3 protein [Candidatus Nanopelagicales bacterium]